MKAGNDNDNIIEIDSKFSLGAHVEKWSIAQIKKEPMFWQSSLDFVLQHKAPIHKNFIENLKFSASKYGVIPEDIIIDSRIHMFVGKNIYPAIPGWHHDDVPRGLNGQPDYLAMPYKANHALALYGDPVCQTEFATGSLQLQIPDSGVVYEQWHPQIERLVRGGYLKSHICDMHRIYLFDAFTWHQAVPSTGPGWRFFIRASWGFDGHRKPMNEIRNNAQVYMPYPNQGW